MSIDLFDSVIDYEREESHSMVDDLTSAAAELAFEELTDQEQASVRRSRADRASYDRDLWSVATQPRGVSGGVHADAPF